MKQFFLIAVLLAGAAWCAAAEPETVVVTFHAKPGSEAELQRVIERHWATATRLNLVADSPHVTLKGEEDGKSYFVEIFTWRDGSIPDSAPAEIQAIWKQMNDLVESRGGQPGLNFRAVSVIAEPR